MRKIIVITIFFNALILYSQKKEMRIIAEINNDYMRILENEKEFIAEINKEFFDNKNFIKSMSIEKNITKGDSNKTYYYLKLSSEKKDFNRLLLLKNNNLYIVKSNENEYTIYDLYFSCEGSDDSCGLRLFYVDKDYIWSCSENMYCEINNTCQGSTTIF